MKGSVTRLAGVFAVVTVGFAPVVNAQEPTLDEIIVTSQKREQSALDVPITVDVFTAANIENTGALSMAEMQDFVPGFEVGSNPTQAGITIRGVSSANISSGGDPSVATFYDGTYVPRAATQVLFSDMQRIEVLKGPQGTLFGRNAAAGVVSMVPNLPGEENEGFVKARVGNHALVRAEAMGNLALSDNFFLRANVLTNQRDGYADNVIQGGRDPGEQQNIAARISGLWRLSDVTELQLSYDYDELDNSALGAFGLSQWSECPDDPFCGRVRNDVIDGTESRDMYAITGKLFHSFSDALAMKFITSYRDFEVINRQDEDGTAEPDRYLDTDNIEESDVQYNELQFNYSNERMNLVFGANYSRENTYQVIPINTNADSAMRAVTAEIWGSLSAAEQGFIEMLLGGPLDHIWDPVQMAILLNANGIPVAPQDVAMTGDFFYDQLDMLIPQAPIVGPSFAGAPWTEMYINDGEFTNWGIYGDVDYALTDRWNVLFGLRYSKDKKEFSWTNPENTLNSVRPGTVDLAFLPVPGYLEARTGTLRASNDWSKVTGRAVASYSISDSATTYLSYSTGYKSGGYDSLDVRSSDNPLRPEESENIELGLKGDFFSDRLRAQLSFFDMTIDGRQRTVDTLEPGQPQAIPRQISGDQEVEGIEMVLNWAATDDFRVGFLTTWRDSKATWEEHYNAIGDLVTEVTKSSTDTDYTVTLDWTPDLSNGSLNFHVDYIFNSDNSALDPEDVIIDPRTPGYGIDRKELNARFAWTTEDDRMTIALWGKNLTDQQRARGVSNRTTAVFGTPYTRIVEPRTWGLDVAVRF